MHATKRWLHFCLFVFCAFPLCAASATDTDEAPQADDSAQSAIEAPQQTFFLWQGTGTPLVSVLSLDAELLLRGVTNLGWGAGIRYERYLWNHFAGKAGFGHGTFKVKGTDEWCTTVSVSLFALYYPFTRELRGFYTGVGGYFDFVGYFGDEDLPENLVTNFISVYPLVGYKLWFCRWLMLDFFAGYKIAFMGDDGETFGDVDAIIGSGVKWGVSLKFNF